MRVSRSGEPRILEPHKCSEIGWFSVEEIKAMNLSIVSKFNFDNYLKYLKA